MKRVASIVDTRTAQDTASLSIVSAMGDDRRPAFDSAAALTQPPEREMDILLSAGERISMASRVKRRKLSVEATSAARRPAHQDGQPLPVHQVVGMVPGASPASKDSPESPASPALGYLQGTTTSAR